MTGVGATYTNPVYPHYLADPFVLRHGGRYYAYGTAPHGPQRQVFPVLTSPDLIRWEHQGWALTLPDGADDAWAPEVAFDGQRFCLYYSAHGIGGRDHQLRVATSPQPLGPFTDCGAPLLPDDPFTIDAHPFQDANGAWYLFYARDFLEPDGAQRVGTGIVVDRLLEMTALAGEPRVVVRPHADWHLFQAWRPMYGGVYDWHTVEGPALRVHQGRYYCFYSGGAWERDNYGVSYVVADRPLGPYRAPAHLDGPLLRTAPGQVVGPGHNSFTASPDGSQEIIVYHGWDAARTARLMRIDRLRWDGDRPILDGPTWTPQPAPP